MSQPYEVAVLVGSLRKDSLNRKAARALQKLAPANLSFRFVEIGDLPLYDEDIEAAAAPAAWTRFREQVKASDAVLFVTPEYNRSVPGGLKNAIDVGSRPYGKSVWNQMPAAIVSASPGSIGGFGANHQVRQAAVFLNMPVMQHPEAYLSSIKDEDFGPDGLLAEGRTRDFVGQIAAAFADWVTLVKRSRDLIEEK